MGVAAAPAGGCAAPSPSPQQTSQTTSFFFIFFKKILVHLVLNPRVGAQTCLPSAQEGCGVFCVGCLTGHIPPLARAVSCTWGRFRVQGGVGSFGGFRPCLGHLPPLGQPPSPLWYFYLLSRWDHTSCTLSCTSTPGAAVTVAWSQLRELGAPSVCF